MDLNLSGGPEIGAHVGPYKLLAVLGRGGTAIVYRAADRQQHEVAIKVYRERHGLTDRFWREIEVIQSLRHEGLIQVLDFGLEPWPHLIMELIRGTTLKQWLKTDPVLMRRRGLVTELLTAVGYAHERQVLHRDLKPDNVFVREGGRAAVGDFGSAQHVDDVRLTTTGRVQGTPGYVSPEQLSGEKATPLSDQYSLGVVTFEILTGRAPFAADTSLARIYLQLNGPLPSVRSLRPDLPEPVAACVQRMMARRPQQRFRDLQEAMACFLAAWPDWIGPPFRAS